jgi:hypothetical protein
LIADDNEDDREIIQRALRGITPPISCQEASSVKGAVSACQKSNFDCVILDYSFPGEDGLKGLAILHEQYPNLPIVMVTGQGDEMIAREAMLRGAVDYMPKARITGSSVKRIIENAMEKAGLRRQIAEQQDAISSFNRVLAHDLKVPLSAVTGFTQILRRGLEQGDTKAAAALCSRIERASHRMGALIDALHAYAKPETTVRMEPISMSQVMDDTAANLDQIIRERGARVTWGSLPIVTGNAPMLINLLQNLIANAIKFCEAETPAVHVSATPQNGEGWLFAVKDNGIGIPEDAQAKIFEAFTRLDHAGKYEGTGLGLATCRKIVERHQGRIWCESQPGEGTTMLFTLPGAKAQPSAA